MPNYVANGFLLDSDTGALIVTTTLADGEYVTDGLVREADGSLSVVIYDAGDAATYRKQNGYLVDAAGRLVVIEDA